MMKRKGWLQTVEMEEEDTERLSKKRLRFPFNCYFLFGPWSFESFVIKLPG
jgi:hypothetical protein